MKEVIIRNKEDYNKNLNDEILTQSFNVYVRVSTIQQIDNTSLDNQTQLGLQFIKNSITDSFKYVIVWREEGKSGDDFNDGVSEIVKRELLSIIIKKWESQTIKNLWVYDLSRLSRNDDSSNLLKGLIYKNGIDLYVNNQKYDFDNKMDKLLFGVLSIVNEFENHQRFEKGLMGKLKILEDNKHWGGPTPFGYDKDEDGRLIPHKFTSKMVKMIFQQYSKGVSIKKIRNKLEELNVWTQRGNKKWNDGSIRLILKNELYLGKLKYEVKLLKGKSKEYCREKGMTKEKIISCPQLIDKVTFDKVQSQISKNKRSSKRPIVNENVLLRGLLQCGNCGLPYWGRINEKQNINTYNCTSSVKKFRDSTISCDNKRSINIRLTDDLVWNMILDVFQNSERIKKQFRDENIPKELNDPKVIKRSINNLQNKIDRRHSKTIELENRRNELYENYLSLKINKNTLDRLMEISNQTTLEVLEEIKQLESEIQILKGGVEWEDWFEDFDRYLLKIKSYTSIDQKQKFIESIVDKIIISWDNVTNTHNLKIKFRLHIVKDKGKEIGNRISEIKKGKKTLDINELDFKKGWINYRKFLKQNTSYKNHSTVTDLARFLGWSTLRSSITAI